MLPTKRSPVSRPRMPGRLPRGAQGDSDAGLYSEQIKQETPGGSRVRAQGWGIGLGHRVGAEGWGIGLGHRVGG